MSETLPSGIRVYTWWKRHGLRPIVEEYVQSVRPEKVRDLLPDNYRKSLFPWPPKSVDSLVETKNYPGQGQGSNYRRGEDLAKLVRGDQI